MSRESVAQSFDIAQYRQAFLLITSRLGISEPNWKFESITILTADILNAIDALASGKDRPADAGTGRVSEPEVPAPSGTENAVGSQVALARSETMEDAECAPTSTLRAALEGAAMTLDLEPPFAEDDAQLALDIHAAMGRVAEVDADARKKLTDDLASARTVVNRISEILLPGTSLDPDAMVERVQAWSALRVKLQRRVLECQRNGLPELGNELAGYLAGIMSGKEFGAWLASTKFTLTSASLTGAGRVRPANPDAMIAGPRGEPLLGVGPFTESDLVDIAKALSENFKGRHPIVGKHVLRTFVGASKHRSLHRRFARDMNDFYARFASDADSPGGADLATPHAPLAGPFVVLGNDLTENLTRLVGATIASVAYAAGTGVLRVETDGGAVIRITARDIALVDPSGKGCMSSIYIER